MCRERRMYEDPENESDDRKYQKPETESTGKDISSQRQKVQEKI
jgi:hypothetical protein